MNEGQLDSVDASEAAQDAGECLGWAGTAGADPAVATIASALLLGRSAGARKFFAIHQDEIDLATRALIMEAFAIESTEGASAAARVLSPLVSPSPTPQTRSSPGHHLHKTNDS
jgi:hypothetical protein